jgi:phage shock protein PspC (stress-responsive transcriptional regulator)
MNTTTTDFPGGQPGPSGVTPEPEAEARSRTLSRPRDDRMVAGVAAGIARYVGVDVLLVRIAFAVLTLVGGVGIPLYVACWLLVPDEGSTQSIIADLTSTMQSWRN